MDFPCTIDLHGKPHFGPEWKAAPVYLKLQKYHGKRAKLVVEVVESQKKRKFFEGAMVPYFCTLFNIFDRKNPDDRAKVREMMKQEFGGEIVPSIGGGVTKVCTTSKGKVDEILNNATDWLKENGYAIPDPELFKKWRDVLLREDDDYMDWLNKNNLNVDGSTKEIAGIDAIIT